MKRFLALLLLAGAAVLVFLLLFVVPLPHHTPVEGVVWLPEEANVRAGSDGFVRAVLVPSGTLVKAGQALVVSEDPQLAAWLKEGLEAAEMSIADLQSLKGTDARKAALASLLWQGTTVSQEWLAKRLGLSNE